MRNFFNGLRLLGVSALTATLAITAVAQNQPTGAAAEATDPVAAATKETKKEDATQAASAEAKAKADKAAASKREPIRDARDTAKDARKGAVETSRDARQEGRQTATGDRQEGRETARDGRRGARNTAIDAAQSGKNARQEGREGARDARRDATSTAKGARRDAREVGRESRETVRETRRENLGTFIRSLRPADLGLWFNSHTSIKGLVVSDVGTQGAIAQAGFKEGDRIAAVNGQPVATEEQFMRLLVADKDEEGNQPAKITVMRDGREQSISAQPSALVNEMAKHDPLWQSGIALDERDPNKVVVQKVFPRTPAYYAGLRSGDVITGVRGQRIAKIADLVKGFTAGNGNVDLQINRANRTRDLEIVTTDEGAEVRTVLKPNADEADRTARSPERNRVDVPADQKPSLNPTPSTTTPKDD